MTAKVQKKNDIQSNERGKVSINESKEKLKNE